MVGAVDYSYTRYLFAKRTVDDRALNRVVLGALGEAMRSSAFEREQVLELGAGVGTMISRLVDWQVLTRAHCTLVDRDAESLLAAERHLAEAAPSLELRFVEREIFTFLAEARERYGLVVSNAVLDLLHVPTLLEAVLARVFSGALLWFTINFDGESALLPELPLDAEVMRLYHRSMDVRVRDGRPAGDSRTGRHLLEQLPAAGASVLEAGSSDWVVWPKNGSYLHDEAYFLHHIVHTMDEELRGNEALDAAEFEEWVGRRHRQIERGELCYIAHQLDVLARAP
jgi:hypothetical protein